MTAPGASAPCAREALGCSSGDTSGAGRTNLLPALGLSREMGPAALPGPHDSGGGGSVFSGPSPDSRPCSARWALRPQRRSGVARGGDDRVWPRGAVMSVSSGAQVVRCGEEGARVLHGRPCGCVSL